MTASANADYVRPDEGVGCPQAPVTHHDLCPDGHDPALATGVCTRCGYDLYDYYDDILDPTTGRLVPRRCSHDGHLTHPKGRYGTYADGRDAEPCTTINDWGQ